MKETVSILNQALLTEKATMLSANLNKYSFTVASSASRTNVKTAVENAFGVKVLKVNTMNYQGKVKRRYKEGGSGGEGGGNGVSSAGGGGEGGGNGVSGEGVCRCGGPVTAVTHLSTQKETRIAKRLCQKRGEVMRIGHA